MAEFNCTGAEREFLNAYREMVLAGDIYKRAKAANLPYLLVESLEGHWLRTEENWHDARDGAEWAWLLAAAPEKKESTGK